MLRLRHLNSLRDMSRIKRYLISIGLVFGVALIGAAWLSAY